MIYLSLFYAEDILVTKCINYSREWKHNVIMIKQNSYIWNEAWLKFTTISLVVFG